MLELAILGLLKERAMHGYELKTQLGQRLGFFWKVSWGSLYPALRKLEKLGAVEKFAPREPAPRRKQVYRVTALGEQMFLDLLTEGVSSAWEDEKYPLRLAFFRYLKPEIRLRLLERRKAHLEDRLDEGQARLRRAKTARSDPYTLSLIRHGVDLTASDITWLDELIAAERAAIEPSRQETRASRGPDERTPTTDTPVRQ